MISFGILGLNVIVRSRIRRSAIKNYIWLIKWSTINDVVKTSVTEIWQLVDENQGKNNKRVSK